MASLDAAFSLSKVDDISAITENLDFYMSAAGVILFKKHTFVLE
jgi:hypothetical protein